MNDDYTLSDAEALSKAKRFSIQLWAREGLLKTTDETTSVGRGKARHFSSVEVELAAILSTLSRHCTLEFLRKFAEKYRDRSNGHNSKEKTGKHIEAARKGDDKIYILAVVDSNGGGTVDIIRWDGATPLPAKRIQSAPTLVLINLASCIAPIHAKVPR